MQNYFDEMFSVFAAAGYEPEAVYNMLKSFFFRNQFNSAFITKAELEELFEKKREYYDYVFSLGFGKTIDR